jgi:SAM-dependent methyltransferase
MADARQYAPATARNRDPILAVLRRTLPVRGVVLEIASGTGEHVAHFAGAFPELTFQPSDPDAAARASIAAWTAGLGNVLPPLALDVTAPAWPIAAADALICSNMVHISPWAATEGLIAGAARLLPPGAPLYLYGPYRRDGVPTAPSNEEFDASLRRRNPEWGLRRIEALTMIATAAGFDGPEISEMPANNISAVFRRTSAGVSQIRHR